MNGGYDDGYQSCNCFWGNKPGKLIEQYLRETPVIERQTALDLGCGEGKNSIALANAGFHVTAVDCSIAALKNARSNHGEALVSWKQADAKVFLVDAPSYDLIVMYGLLHCLKTAKNIAELIGLALKRTKIGGTNILVAFNDGPHDLSAHPNFKPTLLSHTAYIAAYAKQDLVVEESEIIHETHPHNDIPHFHSLTRIVVRRVA